MLRKPSKMIVLVGLILLVCAAWHVAAAPAGKEKMGKKPALPSAAAAAVKKAFPKATVGKIEREKEGIVLYEVELEQNGKEFEVEVTAYGRIVSMEKKVARTDLPGPVARTLAREAGDAKIEEIEKEKIHAVVKLVILDTPQIVYEAKFVQNGKTIEVKIAEDGKLLGKEVEDDDDDDEGENEKEISLDQVPAAVKATILKQAGENKIKEIEVETRAGKKIYEAEWVEGDKEVEIKVASDGTFLGKEIEDEDDEDDED